jgi:hypothetical protein
MYPLSPKRKQRHSQIVNVFGDEEMDRKLVVQEVADCERRPQNNEIQETLLQK